VTGNAFALSFFRRRDCKPKLQRNR
jgi:hypothetical protein